MPIFPRKNPSIPYGIMGEINRMTGGYTNERYEWANAWRNYTDAKISNLPEDCFTLRTKFKKVIVGDSEYAVVTATKGEHLKTLALYAKIFGIDKRWLLQKKPFTTPGWWWVAMDPAHQRMSGLKFPYKPKKAK